MENLLFLGVPILKHIRVVYLLPVRPSSSFPVDNLSIYSRNFVKFCIHIVIGDEWYEIVNGQNPFFLNRATALVHIGKWFLTCHSFTIYGK